VQSRVSLADMKRKSIDEKTLAARADLLIQIASPEVAAEKLGRTVKEVLARRLELGLSDPLSARQRLAKLKAK
jgi:hypothetical protein